MARKVRSLEQSIRNMQGLEGPKNISYKDLCMSPNVHLPLGFEMSKFDKYEGHGNPVAYLKKFCNQLRGAGGKKELLMAYFGESLTGIASEWFIDQDIFRWHVWDDMARDFVQQFQYNIEIMERAGCKSQTIDKKTEMIDIFLQAQGPAYFHHLLSTIGSTFAEAIKVGEMVENGIKSGKIISKAALKATTQAIQSGSGSFGENKRKEDVATVVPAPRQNWRCARQPYAQNLLYFISSPQYPSHNAQPYAEPLLTLNGVYQPLRIIFQLH
ncbi:hypothetical protein P3S67_029034 [Capsicum chacoense]